MTERQATLIVARWEFLRFLKPRQQVISFLVTIAINLLLAGVGYLIKESRSKPVTVAVVGVEHLGGVAPTVDRVTWRTTPTDVASLRRLVDTKAIDGYVVVASPDSVRVVLRDKARWPDRVMRVFDSVRTARVVAASEITPQQLQSLGSRFSVATTYTKRARDSSRGDRILAFVMLMFVFTGVITGVSYLFTGITGEKTLRVTESVLSAISPQAWLDGKILGQLGVALVSITSTCVSFGLVGITAFIVFRDRLPAVIPWPHISAVVAIQVVVLALLGMVLWFAALGAFTSTIDDPNNSMRSTSLMLPMLPIVLAWSVQDKADSVLATVLSVFPLTSYAVLPVRLAITTPAWWEFPLAFVLLLGGIWLVRRAGGRLFAAGIQMYGKEPSWRDMWRAVRAAPITDGP